MEDVVVVSRRDAHNWAPQGEIPCEETGGAQGLTMLGVKLYAEHSHWLDCLADQGFDSRDHALRCVLDTVIARCPDPTTLDPALAEQPSPIFL